MQFVICCMVVWFYGCMAVWLYGCMAVWLYGCMVVWLYGCMVVWQKVKTAVIEAVVEMVKEARADATFVIHELFQAEVANIMTLNHYYMDTGICNNIYIYK